MKKIHYILIAILSLLVAGLTFSSAVFGDTIGTLDVFKIVGSLITPRDATKGFQIPALSSSGGPCISVDGSGTFSTTTCGSGGGGGNTTFTIGNGLIYNATSTDLVGIGTITPTTTLFVQGKGGTNPFLVASSTGSALLTLNQAGNLSVSGLGTCSNGVISGAGGLLSCNGSAFLTGNQSITLTGVTTGSGATSIATIFGVGDFATGTTGGGFNIATTTTSLTINLPNADASHSGQLTSTDWGTFNGKQNALSGGTNGRVTYWTSASALGASAALLTDGTVVGVNATSSNIAFEVKGISGANAAFLVTTSTGNTLFQITPDGIASSTNVNISALGTCSNGLITSANGVVACNASAFLTGNQSITLSGAVTGSGATAITTSFGLGAFATGTAGGGFNIATTTSSLTINIPNADSTHSGQLTATDWGTFNGKQNALTNPDTGTGAAGQVAVWSGTTALTGDGGFLWSTTNHTLAINSTTPNATLVVQGSSTAATLDIFRAASSSNSTLLSVTAGGNVNVATLTVNTLVFADASKNLASKAVPDCQDSGGNHLNWNNSTFVFSCGTSTSGGSGGLGVMNSEAPTSGSINGVNKVFTFADNIQFVTLNDAVQDPNNDVTISGNQATFVNAPVSGSSILNWFVGATNAPGVNGKVARWTSASLLSTGVLLDDGTVAGVNATSSSYSFNVQPAATANTKPFNVASSTGTSMLFVDTKGNLNIATLTASSLLGTDAAKNLQSLTIATSTSGPTPNLLLSGTTLTLTAPAPNFSTTTPANPAGTATTSPGTMAGLNATLTPKASGIIRVEFVGDETAGANKGVGGFKQIRYGTGTAPANGGLATSGLASCGSSQNWVNPNSTSANGRGSFTVSCIVSNLTIGTTYWFDLVFGNAGAAGTYTLANVSSTLYELK